MLKKRRKRGSRPTIHLVALLAVLAVPAVSWALPQHTTAKPPGMGGGGGGEPRAAEPYGPPAPEPVRAPLISPPRVEAPKPAAVTPAQPASGASAGAPTAVTTSSPGATSQAGATSSAAAAATGEQGADAVEKIMAEGAAVAATLHGAIAVHDWEAARREQVALRDVLARMREPDLGAPTLAARVARLQAITPQVEGAITRRDTLRANDAAYRLVYGMVDAITAQAATRGGGGGAPAPAVPAVIPPPVEHLRQGYPEVMKAHAALLSGEPAEAKAHLDGVREHLQAALKGKPGAVFARRLDNLNKARWRVVAALGDQAKAQRLSIALTRAYAEAVHAVGQYATIGGGGGTPAAPRGLTGVRAQGAPSRSLRAILRPQRDRTRGTDAIPYDKRGV